MSEFLDECRQEWQRLGVPDPIANEMAADLAADIEEAESEGGSAEDVLGNERVRPPALCRVVGGGPRGHGAPRTTNPNVSHSPVAAGRCTCGIGGTPCPGCRRVGGWSPECRLSGISSPVRGRPALGPRLPWFSHRVAAFPTCSGRRILRNPPAGPRCRRHLLRRFGRVSVERRSHRALGDSPTPCSIRRSQDMIDLRASFKAGDAHSRGGGSAGRYLHHGETVDHRNGVRDDNRPENLEQWMNPQPSGIRVSDAVARGSRDHESRRVRWCTSNNPHTAA